MQRKCNAKSNANTMLKDPVKHNRNVMLTYSKIILEVHCNGTSTLYKKSVEFKSVVQDINDFYFTLLESNIGNLVLDCSQSLLNPFELASLVKQASQGENDDR